MAKYKAKALAQWNNFLTTLQKYPRSTVLIDCDDFAAWAINLGQTLAGIGQDKLLPGFTCCHAFNFISGIQTFEANGKKLAYGNINDYKARFLSGDCRLAVFFPKPVLWSAQAPALFDRAVKEYLNENYNGWELFGFAVLDLFHVNGVLKNPFFKNNSCVCDQLTALVYKYITLLYNALLGGMDISDLQPQNLCVNVPKAEDLIIDSENA